MTEAVDVAIDEKTVSIVRGALVPDCITVYSVVRNEMYFLPAFLEHYRHFGITQFLFLDDRSDDGTFEYLCSQPDCVVAGSALRYGEWINGRRAGHVWKSSIPHKYLLGSWAICADADEFLFIPPKFSTFNEFTALLDMRGISAVAATMVDFYPATLNELETNPPPVNKMELFSGYPWFDAGPYFKWSLFSKKPIVLDGGVRERLWQKHGISKRRYFKSGLKLAVHRVKCFFFGDRNINSIGKVPLVKWSADKFYLHSHTLNQQPDRSIVLPIAHFKFTSYLAKKIEMAIASRAHSGGSRAYFAYADLLAAMRAGDRSFLGPKSVKFTGVEDFAANGLMKFDP